MVIIVVVDDDTEQELHAPNDARYVTSCNPNPGLVTLAWRLSPPKTFHDHDTNEI